MLFRWLDVDKQTNKLKIKVFNQTKFGKFDDIWRKLNWRSYFQRQRDVNLKWVKFQSLLAHTTQYHNHISHNACLLYYSYTRIHTICCCLSDWWPQRQTFLELCAVLDKFARKGSELYTHTKKAWSNTMGKLSSNRLSMTFLINVCLSNVWLEKKQTICIDIWYITRRPCFYLHFYLFFCYCCLVYTFQKVICKNASAWWKRVCI